MGRVLHTPGLTLSPQMTEVRMAMSPTVTARCNTVNGGGGGGSVRASEYTSGDTNPPLRVYQVLSSSVHGNWIESCGACCGRTPWRARNSAGNTFEPHAAVWVPQATLSEMSTRQNTRRLALAPIARKDERPKAKKSCLRRLYSFRRHVCCRNPMAAALLAWWWRLGKTLLCARLARCISSRATGLHARICKFQEQQKRPSRHRFFPPQQF